MVGASPEAIRLGKIICAVTYARGGRGVIWCTVGKHGAISGMPERSMVGRCECWKEFPDVID